MTSPTWRAFVDDQGAFALDDRRAFRDWVRQFKGQELLVSVHPKTAARTLHANAYYWGVVVQAAHNESGQAAGDIHAFWCELFLPDEKKRLEFVNRLTGQRLQVRIDARRTSRLSGTAFYDYVESCRLWCSEYLGVTTPDPDASYWRKRVTKTEAEGDE